MVVSSHVHSRIGIVGVWTKNSIMTAGRADALPRIALRPRTCPAPAITACGDALSMRSGGAIAGAGKAGNVF
jgi:hypothetical protein